MKDQTTQHGQPLLDEAQKKFIKLSATNHGWSVEFLPDRIIFRKGDATRIKTNAEMLTVLRSFSS